MHLQTLTFLINVIKRNDDYVTQQNIADLLGISRQTLINRCNDPQKYFSDEDFDRLRQVFGVEFIDGKFQLSN